jgi:hypothetical protein
MVPQVVGQYHVRLDSSLLEYYSIFQVYTTNNLTGIIGFNHETRSLDFINLKSGSKENSIRLDQAGYNITPEFGDFFYYNFDSIFFCYDEYKLISLNASTGTITSYNLNNEILGRVQPVMGFKLEFIPHERILQFNAPFYKELFNRVYYKTPIIGEFDISKNKMKRRYGFHPSIYHSKKNEFPIMTLPSKMNFDGKCYLSFGPDPYVYIYDRSSSELINKVLCRSNHVQVVKPIKRDGDFQIGLDYLSTTPFYYKILLDKNNGCFYRIVKMPQNLYDDNGRLSQRWTGPWSIVIWDLSLNAIIGEAELDAGKYNYRFSFVSGDGFCVAKSTPEKGDVITFDIIKFSKLQTGL